MASNRLHYDRCYINLQTRASVGPLKYRLTGEKHYNCDINQCPAAKNAVDRQFIGKRVDMESELKNQTRYNSNCPSRKYIPCDLNDVAYPDYNNGFGCKPLTYKIGYSTCMKEQPSINPYSCERYVTYRTNLQMPNYRGFDRTKFDSYEYCNQQNNKQ